MARPEKEAAVAELTAKLKEFETVLVTDYRGLRVRAMNDLRRQLRGNQAECIVAKNTLMRRAADAAGMPALAAALEGPTAVVFASAEPGPAVKALLAFARQNTMPSVRAVLMGGRLYPASSAKDLATLPGRAGVLALLMSGLEAPITTMLATLEAPMTELLATLEAIAKQRESVAA